MRYLNSSQIINLIETENYDLIKVDESSSFWYMSNGVNYIGSSKLKHINCMSAAKKLYKKYGYTENVSREGKETVFTKNKG